MPAQTSAQASAPMTWLVFALMTVACWGVYGILLHSGVMAFEPKIDPTARYKAFFWVGIAYFLTAVLAPLAILIVKGTSWDFLTHGKGLTWSLLAGIAGAIGAFCVLLAFGAKGSPAVVMSIIFAGAPVVNAIVALILHPPHGGISSIKPQFVAGILLAAVGGCLVTLYKPDTTAPPKAKPDAAQTTTSQPAPPAKPE